MQRVKRFIEKRGTLLFFFFTFLMFLTYTYDDLVTTQGFGIAFWDALFEGKVFHFYQYCNEHCPGVAGYDMTIYFIFAIWNLPCSIFEKISGLKALDFELWITYGKALVLIAYYFSIKQFAGIYKKICNKYPDHERPSLSVKSAAFFYATSVLLLCYSVLSGNYDVLSLVFILAGVNALLDNKKVLFLFFFAVATSMKYFAAWLFLPLLLLKEKRVTRIILNFVLCFIPSVIESWAFHKSSALAAINEEWYMAGSGIVGLANSGKMTNFGLGSVSLCVLIYILLCVYCYLQKNDDDYLFVRNMTYVSAAAWIIFYLFYSFNCYWIVLMVPFAALLVVTDRKKLYISTILELLLSVAFYINCQMRQAWVLGRFYKHGLLKELFVRVFGFENFETGTLGALIDMNKLNAMYPIDIIVNTVIVAAGIALLIIHFPGKRYRESMPSLTVSSRTTSMCVALRTIINLMIFTIPVLCYIYQIVKHNIAL